MASSGAESETERLIGLALAVHRSEDVLAVQNYRLLWRMSKVGPERSVNFAAKLRSIQGYQRSLVGYA